MYYGEVFECVFPQMRRGLFETFRVAESANASQIPLNVELEPWDDLGQVIPLTLVIEEYLVLQRVHVRVMPVEVVYQTLLRLPFVHHLT